MDRFLTFPYPFHTYILSPILYLLPPDQIAKYKPRERGSEEVNSHSCFLLRVTKKSTSWFPRAHFPSLLASSDCIVTCTKNLEERNAVTPFASAFLNVKSATFCLTPGLCSASALPTSYVHCEHTGPHKESAGGAQVHMSHIPGKCF